MSRKSVLGAWCAGHGACEITARRTAAAAGLQRSFTSTAQRNANITKFTPTDSPALDELLDNIRTKIILPAHLPAAQRKKMYSPKYQKTLQSDPIIMEIDGEILKFRHLNRLAGDVPPTQPSVLEAVSKFNTKKDFANFLPLLEGVQGTKNFDSNFYCKVIRLLGEKDRIQTMIECARRVKTTGFRLNQSEKVVKMLFYIQMKAIKSNWDLGETRQALRWAEMVLEMLQEEEHQVPEKRSGEPVEGQLPLFRDPLVLLAPLHLAATLAKHEEAKDEVRDKIAKYAKAVTIPWPEQKGLKQVQPKDLYKYRRSMYYLKEPNTFVTLATPLLYGLERAVEVADPEQAAKLDARRKILAAEVQEAREAHRAQLAEKIEAARAKGEEWPNKSPRSEAIYQQLFGEAPV
ncbi:hypothetical protein F4809DRAFT_587962 [Biscogniauxia mediterranea]|nr:hypothetical protein F4809DRAFT_587962 [Biscogniauxia mediterranea]